jgi:hypothetical protein
MDVLEAFYRYEVANFPAELQRVAIDLPRRIGISKRPRGGWSDYVRLAPFRDTPRVAAKDLAISNVALLRFRHASWWGGFFCLTLDRIIDGQAHYAELVPVLNHLFTRWRDALARAMDAPECAERVIADAILFWSSGVALERREFGARLSVSDYVASVLAKVRWVSATACAMVHTYDSGRTNQFFTAMQLLLLAAQFEDDARDSEEDARLMGHDVPTALGMPTESLLGAARGVLGLSAQAARVGRFFVLANWIDKHTSTRLAPVGISGVAALALVRAAHEQTEGCSNVRL